MSGKGGTGKSTLCFGVALALAKAGRTVRVVDLDPQRSITEWIDPERDLVETTGEATFTLVDTPPRIDAKPVLRAIAEADLVVMPCGPSPADVGAAAATVEVVQRHLKPKAKAVLAINKLRTSTILGGLVRDAIAPLSAPTMTAEIPDRQCLQRMVLGGWSELDVEAKDDFLSFTLEIFELTKP